MTEQIPSVRLDNREVWEALLPRLEDMVLAGRFTLGPELDAFEREASVRFGTAWCVGVSSGTAALSMVLRAALPPGARVAIPANTFFATFEAVSYAGHRPVIVDIDRDHLLDLDALDGLNLDAVIPVHLFGLPVDMTRLAGMARANGWFVLEDASQAHGASVRGKPVGSLGDAAGFSAYPTKNLGAWGDAGFITGNDKALEEKLRALRHHGQSQPNVHKLIGGTDRLDNLQALVLSEKLLRLDAEVEARRWIAARYRAELEGVFEDLPGDRKDRTHVFHQFVVRVPERDRVRRDLEEHGVSTSTHYPTPVHLQPAARGACDVPERPDRAEASAREIVSLPMFPGLTEEQGHRVAVCLKEAMGL